MQAQQSKEEEQALKISQSARGFGRGRGARTGQRGRGGRGRGRVNKDQIECFKCHKLGHYQSECPTWEENDANYAEFDDSEEMLLMAKQEFTNAAADEVWFLDSGCSNHMVGTKEWLFDFDDSFRSSVKLGNDSKMQVMGKGNLKLFIGGITQVITDVHYLPGLSNNLLSIGQLQQKNLTIMFQKDMCKVFHEERGLIMSTQMSANRMYIIHAPVIIPKCLKVSSESETQLWHDRYGHLSYKGLKTLVKKEMVKGLPELKEVSDICSKCMVGKQHREPISKSAKWRATMKLELIHSDVCGPVNPQSNGGNSNEGIKRQLTTAYTPQQNGVSERKNRTIMNMVRCLLAGRNVPKTFWPEAVKWATYVLNRNPTLSVKDVTPEEAWSDKKNPQ